jgi:hypothetical protein
MKLLFATVTITSRKLKCILQGMLWRQMWNKWLLILQIVFIATCPVWKPVKPYFFCFTFKKVVTVYCLFLIKTGRVTAQMATCLKYCECAPFVSVPTVSVFLFLFSDFQGKCWDTNSDVYMYMLLKVRGINFIYFLLISSQLAYRLHWTSILR